MNIESRLLEYAEWLHEPGMQFSQPSVMGRIQDEQENAGARGSGMKYEMVDDVPCRPDGGIAALVERMDRALSRDKRCRELREALDALKQISADGYAVIDALYGGHWRDMPRSLEGASLMLGVKIGAFRERKTRAIAWLAGRLMLPVDKPAKAA